MPRAALRLPTAPGGDGARDAGLDGPRLAGIHDRGTEDMGLRSDPLASSERDRTAPRRSPATLTSGEGVQAGGFAQCQ
jgi:hypothetical protein